MCIRDRIIGVDDGLRKLLFDSFLLETRHVESVEVRAVPELGLRQLFLIELLIIEWKNA